MYLLEQVTEVELEFFISKKLWFWYFGSREGGREARAYIREHPHGLIHVVDSYALDLTCQKDDVEGDVFERGFGPVVGTWYLGSCKRYYRTAKSEPTEASFPLSHVRRVKCTKHNHWLLEYYSNEKKRKKENV